MTQKKEQIAENLQNSSIEIVTVGGQKNCLEAEVPPPKKPENAFQVSVPPIQTPANLDQAAQLDEQKVGPQANLIDKGQDQRSAEEDEAEEVEDQQNLGDESNEQSNSQKSEKKAKSNGQSVDERKEELPTSRKCFNKLCSSKKIFKKIRSRVQDNKYRFFCKSCYENYFNNLYCEFCEQIYSNSCENEDDDKWIGCDRCQRWNHTECQKKYRNRNVNELKDKDALYQCLVCSTKTKNNNQKNKKQDKEQLEDKIPTKQKIEMNKGQRTLIFHKKVENLPNLQYFLQNYNFRLWASQIQAKLDIQHLRATCLKANQQDAAKNKFKKMKND